MHHLLGQCLGDNIGDGVGLKGNVTVLVGDHYLGLLFLGLLGFWFFLDRFFSRFGFLWFGFFHRLGLFGRRFFHRLGGLLFGLVRFRGGFVGYRLVGLRCRSLGRGFLCGCQRILEIIRVGARHQLVASRGAEQQNRGFCPHAVGLHRKVIVGLFILFFFQIRLADYKVRVVLAHVLHHRRG